jgi:transcriptional regulator with XRE-family HTH domain
MARPDCPRCGSDLIVAMPSRAPSQLVLELRGGSAPAVARADGPAHWLCRSCGHRWDPEVHPDTSLLEPQHLPEPADREASRPAPEAATDADPHVSPGTALRTAREERGKTLAQASTATGVWTDQLEALERDAPLEEFPAPAYARLYLREYARFLRLDPEPLLQALDALNPVVEEPTFEPLPDTRGRRKIVAGVLAVLSVVALIIVALNQTGSRRDAGTTPSAGAASVTTHDSGHVPLVGEAARPPTGVRAVLRLTEPSWVQAISDGEVVAAATLQPGEVVGYRARKLLQLTLGNAGGVRLRVNGERVETGTQGEVVTLDLRLRDGTISTARA